MNHDSYSDGYIRGILNTAKSIAMVGISPKDNRPSYFAFKYLLERGYRYDSSIHPVRHPVYGIPDFAPGNFTWDDELDGWVWTTFNRYQWDLDWSNPQVFLEMTDVLLSLANRGVDVFRLDAVAFMWKRLGTNCQNQPEVHDLLQALRACAPTSSERFSRPGWETFHSARSASSTPSCLASARIAATSSRSRSPIRRGSWKATFRVSASHRPHRRTPIATSSVSIRPSSAPPRIASRSSLVRPPPVASR